jgi:CRP-like cAMP-binding protein
MFMPSERIVGLCPTGCVGHKTLLNNMLRIVSNKAMSLNEKIEYLSVRSIREKISKYLIAQYKQQKSTSLFLNMNRNEMADFLNVTRPSLSREMSYMKEEGLIDFHRSSVKILNLEKISTYLN